MRWLRGGGGCGQLIVSLSNRDQCSIACVPAGWLAGTEGLCCIWEGLNSPVAKLSFSMVSEGDLEQLKSMRVLAFVHVGLARSEAVVLPQDSPCGVWIVLECK